MNMLVRNRYVQYCGQGNRMHSLPDGAVYNQSIERNWGKWYRENEENKGMHCNCERDGKSIICGSVRDKLLLFVHCYAVINRNLRTHGSAVNDSLSSYNSLHSLMVNALFLPQNVINNIF